MRHKNNARLCTSTRTTTANSNMQAHLTGFIASIVSVIKMLCLYIPIRVQVTGVYSFWKRRDLVLDVVTETSLTACSYPTHNHFTTITTSHITFYHTHYQEYKPCLTCGGRPSETTYKNLSICCSLFTQNTTTPIATSSTRVVAWACAREEVFIQTEGTMS